MELKTLRYFVVVAEERNITHAAKILAMSQPPLSNQIKNLEEELQTKLFIRGKRNLTLTEEGKYLYQKAKDILSLADKTTDDISSMGQGLSGTIAIGIVPSFPNSITASWFSSFQEQHPNVRFRIVGGDSDSLVEKMRMGLISLAVIAAPYDEVTLNAWKVGKERLMAFVSQSSEYGKAPTSISLQELANAPLIIPGRKAWTDLIKKWFRKIGEPTIAYETDDPEQALSLVQANLGIAILPASFARAGFIARAIENKSIEYDFVWRKGHPLPTIEENFIDQIKTLYPTQE
jgi:DNA-binding transcriptional LysR family regulator